MIGKIIDVINAIVEFTPWWMWVGLIFMLNGLYMLFISPFIYRFWIIPKIEHRYRVKLVFDNPVYSLGLFSNWLMPPLEISTYFTCLYFGWKLPLMKNSHTALRKVNYDLHTATKFEKVMGFITFFNFICLLITATIVGIALPPKS